MNTNHTILAIIMGFILFLWGIATFRKWRRRGYKYQFTEYNHTQIHKKPYPLAGYKDTMDRCSQCGEPVTEDYHRCER